MIRLDNVSKFYYNKGIITSGFTKVNLELNAGEFVVITGESGSGKSTLLNVISGLDTYEEGEMYIDGQETSHYTEQDFEEYRNKYIGNIFQNFNLVNSYTVYQNIELVLLINGYTKDEARPKVEEIIKKVHLEEFAKSKVSKLSGGQKQRVAIARALAKETDIIVADEPTGNLDSKSAESVIQLLSEISKDKLIVVVTHNYEQFESYATRRIKMNDGRISEDEIIKKAMPAGNFEKNSSTAVAKNVAKTGAKKSEQISFKNKLRLGTRNAFNIVPKFILLMVVFLFLVFSVVGEYGSLKKSESEMIGSGYNVYFRDQDETRIVLSSGNKKPLTNSDYKKIEKIEGVKTLEKNDVALDSGYWLEGENATADSNNLFSGVNFSLDCKVRNSSKFEGKIKYGRLPKKNNEIILEVNNNNYYFGKEEAAKAVVGQNVKLHESESDYDSQADTEMSKLKVVGLAYSDDVQQWTSNVYASSHMIEHVNMNAIMYNSVTKIKIGSKEINTDNGELRLVINNDVPKGKVYAADIANGFFSSGSALYNNIEISMTNIYGSHTEKLQISKILNGKNIKSTLGIKDFESCSNAIFVNPSDMKNLTSKNNYQYSVFASDVSQVDKITSQLKDMGYKPLAIKNTLKVPAMEELMFKIVKVPMIVFLILTMFFVSYFVIKLILRSRSDYFVILRILGMNNKNAKHVLDVEMLLDANIAFALLLICLAVVKAGMINIRYLVTLVGMLTVKEIVLLYVVIMAMVYLISRRFSRSLFKKSAMSTFREEV